MKTILVVLLLSGCSTIAGNLPTVQYCDKVVYERNGVDIKASMECKAPISDSGWIK